MFSFFMLLASLLVVPTAQAGDPDILSDFSYISPNGTAVDAMYFTYFGFRVPSTSKPPPLFKIIKATVSEFPALGGQGVSFELLQFPPNSINPFHTHPRGAELLYVLEGTLVVGLVDTDNRLFTQTLFKGDMFVFPKGLVHYQFNSDRRFGAVALSAFGSASPGTVSLPPAMFLSGVDEMTLVKSFKTDFVTVRKIKAGVARPA